MTIVMQVVAFAFQAAFATLEAMVLVALTAALLAFAYRACKGDWR